MNKNKFFRWCYVFTGKQDEHGLHFDNPIFGEGVVRPTSPGNSLKKQQPVQRHSSNVTSANQSVPNARPSSQSVEDIYWSENNSYSSNTDLIDRLANQTRQSLQNRNSVPSLNSGKNFNFGFLTV